MKRRNPNLGCIDPHGMWPFPASREVCPKCRAIRKRGLPYGWWKDSHFWAFTICLLWLSAVAVFLFGAWFWGWGG